MTGRLTDNISMVPNINSVTKLPSTQMQHGLELVQGVAMALQPAADIPERLIKRKRPDDSELEHRAPETVGGAAPATTRDIASMTLAEQAEALYNKWAIERDAPMQGRLLQEFDMLSHASCVQRFKVSFPRQEDNNANMTLQKIMKDAALLSLRNMKCHWTQSTVSTIPLIPFTIADNPYRHSS